MRVDQVITLVWVANVALLGGTGYVGWTFLQQKQAQREVPKVAWPETEQGTIQTRWPGAITAFRHVWETPLNGLVPPPPKAEDTGPVAPVDIGVAFKARIQIETGIEGSDPSGTVAKITDGGQPKQIQLGSSIDGWQLVEFTIDRKTAQARAKFYNPRYEKNDGTVVIEQSVPAMKDPTGAPLWKREVGGPFDESTATLGPEDPQGFFNRATGEWDITAEEVLWWRWNGQKEILEQTRFVPRPGGLEVASMPPRGPLNNTRGITQGDVIVSINDVAVKTLDDVYAYFRGEGRGQRRYVIVIERDGKQRQQIYNVQRRRATDA
jgi:hypothetical protein